MFDFLGDLFGGGQDYPNPAGAASPFLEQIPGIGREHYTPFIEEGRTAAGMANPIYNQMTQDPTAFLNSLMRGYNPSEGYRFKEREMLNAAHNTAAAGGFAGTQEDVRNRTGLVQSLLNEDMQQFLTNLFGIQGAGLRGQERRIDRGYESSGNLANFIAQALGAQAGNAFQGQHQQNVYDATNRSSNMNFLSNVLGTGAGLVSGGGMFGLNGLFG